MSIAPFWYVDDNHHVRWAVRMSQALSAFGADADTEIVFTSREQQLSTSYPLEKEQSELTRYELLELLSRAKLEAVASTLYAGAERAAA